MLYVAYLAVLAGITKPGMAYALVKLNASVKLKRAILVTKLKRYVDLAALCFSLVKPGAQCFSLVRAMA